MAYHALEFPGKTFGGSGVDVFFVLSGFLVGGLLMKEYKKTGGLVAKSFIFRRGFKIWPAYYVFIFAEAAAHTHPLNSFLWQNVFHLQNYVGTSISHTWTLSLEEHFYLLLALSMGWMVKRKWDPMRMLKTFTVVMVCVFCVRCFTVAMGWPGSLQYTHNRIDSLLAGVCLAILFHFYPERFDALAKRPWILAAISALTVAFLVTFRSDNIRNSVGFTIVYIGAAAFLLLVYRHSTKIKEFFLYKGIASIGVYSYGIYLWHTSIRPPAASIAHKLPHALQWPGLMVLQYGMAILVGVVTTQLIEWPFLRFRNKLLPQKVEDIGSPDAKDGETSPPAEPAEELKSKPAKRRILGILLGVCAALLVIAELGARHYGLGNPPLYVSDPDSAYALKPNQDMKRFGNHIHINKWGMRSEDVTDVPAAGILRVLFLGDSVTWGGAYEDQSTTFPYLIAGKLGKTETLNPSCGGWAPANEFGWLKSHGIYHSQLVVLVINDGDLFQPKAPDLAGHQLNYPTTAPLFALQELVSRYLIPRITHENLNDPGTGQDPQNLDVAAASRQTVIDEIKLAQKDGAKVMVLFTKQDPTDKLVDHAPAARKAFADTIKAQGVPLVIANLTDHSQYFGGLHTNAKGNEAIAAQLAPAIGKFMGR